MYKRRHECRDEGSSLAHLGERHGFLEARPNREGHVSTEVVADKFLGPTKSHYHEISWPHRETHDLISGTFFAY